MSLAAVSTRRIKEVGFRSQPLLLGHPESARVGGRGERPRHPIGDGVVGRLAVGRLAAEQPKTNFRLLLMTQCQTNLARNLYLVPQIAALTIVPEARPLPR